jgi:Rap1a immunity proteins
MTHYLAAATVLLGMVITTTQEVGAATVRLLGSDLARDCSASQNYFSYGSCSGYLMGVADMMAQPEWPYPKKACFPEEVLRGQLIAIVKKYIANHADQLQEPALDIVAAALAQAFPCPSR